MTSIIFLEVDNVVSDYLWICKKILSFSIEVLTTDLYRVFERKEIILSNVAVEIITDYI